MSQTTKTIKKRHMKTIKKRFVGNNENREKTSFENDEKTVCPRRGGERRGEVGSMKTLIENVSKTCWKRNKNVRADQRLSVAPFHPPAAPLRSPRN